MLLSARTARRAVAGAVGTGAIAGAMLFGALPSAMADDPANNPPNCTAADLAGVDVGVPLHAPRCELVLHQPRGDAPRSGPQRGAGLPERQSFGQG
jgi:hypothetical protein